jgi:hypothetical protein
MVRQNRYSFVSAVCEIATPAGLHSDLTGRAHVLGFLDPAAEHRDPLARLWQPL